MTDRPYFDEAGEPSGEPGRFVRVGDLDPLRVMDGLDFRPVTTDSVMTTLVTFAPDAPAPMHHHVEQQIAIVLSGQLTFTVGGETRAMHAATASSSRRTCRTVAQPARRGAPSSTCSHRRGPASSRGWT